ncbi:MAG: sigma-70 family RNA polymerase sigma factor [Muribaculaceae bacterium]|nr:sigma-70 family RNA polymerase sigma factor [Muribaculaceae bacterium]
MLRRDFEIEFRRLYMPLCMYALRLCGSTDTAEDVVQDAFVRAWECGTTDVRNFRSYMYRTVRNVALTHMARNGHAVNIDDVDADVADDVMDTSERDARLWEAIGRLPERCRQVLLLSKRDGLSNAEIAAEMGVAVKTVENQMTKALRVLRGHRDVFFLPFL